MVEGEILRSAADILRERGMHRGSCIHPRSGKVDVWGALCLAGGAKPGDLLDDIGLIDTYVPQAQISAVLTAYEYLEEFLGQDVAAWADLVDSATVVRLLEDLGYYLQFAVNER